jgi:hypothetical protein
MAIAGLINLFNPSTVSTGGVAQASEYGVKSTTAILGRRSSSVGALVQIINLAIHETMEHRAHSTKNPSSDIVHTPEFSQNKEVIVNKQ